MLNLFKYSKEEIFSKTILDLIDEEDRKYFIKIVENKLNGKKIDIVHKEKFIRLQKMDELLY